MALELKETKELLEMYETKNKKLMEDLSNVKGELQSNQSQMIGFSEVNKEREEKIAKLKVELLDNTTRADELEIALGTLQIKFDSTSEQLTGKTAELTTVQDNLHVMNKARHDLEIKLEDENKRNQNLLEQLNMRDEALDKRQ